MAKKSKPDSSDNAQATDAAQTTSALTNVEELNFDANALKAIESATMDNVDGSEILYSRMTIMQMLSPEVVEREPGYEAGVLIENQNRQILTQYGPVPWLQGKVEDDAIPKHHYATFLPCMKLPTEFIHWKDRNTEGIGMHWKSLDPADPRVRQGLWPPRGTWQPDPNSKKKSPPVTENLNVLGAFIDPQGNMIGGMTIATFSRTSFKAGKKLVTACNDCAARGGRFWFDFVYYLYTKIETFADNNKAAVVYVANGPRSVEVVQKHIIQAVYQTAAYLAGVDIDDPKERKIIARERQEIILNASNIEELHADTEESPITQDADAAFASEGDEVF